MIVQYNKIHFTEHLDLLFGNVFLRNESLFFDLDHIKEFSKVIESHTVVFGAKDISLVQDTENGGSFLVNYHESEILKKYPGAVEFDSGFKIEENEAIQEYYYHNLYLECKCYRVPIYCINFQDGPVFSSFDKLEMENKLQEVINLINSRKLGD